MKYPCLICTDLRFMMEHLTEADAVKHFDEYRGFTEDIRKNGNYIGGNRLLPPDAATTVRVRDGKVSVTDGPFAETKEQIGGHYVIEKRNRKVVRLAFRSLLRPLSEPA